MKLNYLTKQAIIIEIFMQREILDYLESKISNWCIKNKVSLLK